MLARYVGPRTEKLELIAPGLVHNTGMASSLIIVPVAARS